MSENEITVYAVPLERDESDNIALECSACGPLTVVHPVDAAETIGAHLTEHGCDMSQVVMTKEEHERREE